MSGVGFTAWFPSLTTAPLTYREVTATLLNCTTISVTAMYSVLLFKVFKSGNTSVLFYNSKPIIFLFVQEDTEVCIFFFRNI